MPIHEQVLVNSKVYAAGQPTNARKDASTSSAIVKTYNKGNFMGYVKFIRYIKDATGKVEDNRWFGLSADEKAPSAITSVQWWVREDVTLVYPPGYQPAQPLVGYTPNSKVYASGSGVNVRSGSSLSSSVLKVASKGELVGYLKFVRNDGSYKWFGMSTDPNTPADLKNVNRWVRNDVALVYPPDYVPSSQMTEQDAEKIVNEIVKTDQNIFHSLLRSAESINRISAKGKDTAAYQAKFIELARRFSGRQRRLKENFQVKTGYIKEYETLKSKYAGGSGVNGIGALPLIPVAIIAIVAISAISAAVYYALRKDYDDGKQDLVISSELEGLLMKADPETRQEIVNDLEGQIDTAYKRGKDDQKWENTFNILKYAGIAFAAVWLMKEAPNLTKPSTRYRTRYVKSK